MAAGEKDRPTRPEDSGLFRTVADVAPELWADAASRAPERAAADSGARLDPGGRFIVPYMGGDYLVDLNKRDVAAPPGHHPAGFQKALVLLRYLTQAQDLGLSGRMVTARELNGGALFFTGPHSLLTKPVTDKFGRDPEGFVGRLTALGFETGREGSAVSGRGTVLPNIAVGCILHPEDDEFPAELTYTFDSYAHYHLALDGIWAMINVLADEIAA